MSTGRRAYDILRAYVNHEWDRVQGGGESAPSAEEELAQALDKPWTLRPSKSEPEAPSLPADPKERARTILGASEGDDFQKIHAIYVDLMKRCQPSRFPAGSPDRIKAEQIRKMVQDAYAVLTEDVDETERRFGGLELD